MSKVANREDLVELYIASVPSLGRKRAEALYDAGFDSLEQIVNAKKDDLVAVEGIGPALADKILASASESDIKDKAKETKPSDLKPAAGVAEDGQLEAATEVSGETAEEKKEEETREDGVIKRLLKGRRRGTAEEEKQERHTKIVKKELEAEIKPEYTIELSPEEKRLMRIRARQKYRKPEFNKHDSHKKKRVASSWRRPQGQHNKQRHHFASKGKRVQAGFGSPKSVRGRHPSGFEEVLINYPEELKDIKRTQAVRIAGTVGLRKRLNIEVKCEQLNILLLNPSNLVWEMEEEENTGEKGKKSGKEE